jgi:hypothetical protein
LRPRTTTSTTRPGSTTSGCSRSRQAGEACPQDSQRKISVPKGHLDHMLHGGHGWRLIWAIALPALSERIRRTLAICIKRLHHIIVRALLVFLHPSLPLRADAGLCSLTLCLTHSCCHALAGGTSPTTAAPCLASHLSSKTCWTACLTSSRSVWLL